MKLWLRDLELGIDEDPAMLVSKAALKLATPPETLVDFKIVRRSLDARKKGHPKYVYTVSFQHAEAQDLLKRFDGSPDLQKAPEAPVLHVSRVSQHTRALVVGMGPAGLFAAKYLAEAGLQVILIDRGEPVDQRIRDVEKFWSVGMLKPTSNVQFGEGGAGTFSDGKLTTRIKNPWRNHVLETLVEFGAQKEILIDARPHVGTDRLRKVLVNFRKHLIALGVEIRFNTCLTDLEINHNKLTGGILNEQDLVSCDMLVLATGHSARDTYRMLQSRGIQLESKGFALGVRVDHPAELIDRIQYGRMAGKGLPTADYALRYNDPKTGRGVYSFCMCPGGEVINAASETGGIVVNGMSLSARTSGRSNSALVVTVSPEDWGGAPLGGFEFQRHWEQLAYEAGGFRYHAPAQNLMAFVGEGHGPVAVTCRPGVVEAELDRVLPEFVTQGLRSALPHFDRQMRGFLTREAVLVGVETRTSAPLRITRDHFGESVSCKRLYPAGEGAGYAGGIMSSALDGLGTAQKILQTRLTRGSF